MRFLFFTDDHKRGTSPENRTDNFPATLVRKLKELVEIAQEYEVDYILHGGDFFDVPSPAISVCADFLEVYQQFSVPVSFPTVRISVLPLNFLALPPSIPSKGVSKLIS
jgi:exonuclease SbcD